MVAACGECCCKSSVLGPTACHIGVRELLSEAIASDAQLVCFGLLLLYLPAKFLGFGASAFPLFAAACRLAFFVGGGAVGECIGFSKGTGDLDSFCFFWRCT